MDGDSRRGCRQGARLSTPRLGFWLAWGAAWRPPEYISSINPTAQQFTEDSDCISSIENICHALWYGVIRAKELTAGDREP